MSPDAVIAVGELKEVVFFLVVLLFSTAGAVWFLGNRADKCPRCSHCAAIAKAEADEQKRLQREYARKTGLPQSDEETRERLFGRQVEVPPEEGASGGEDGDAGRDNSGR